MNLSLRSVLGSALVAALVGVLARHPPASAAVPNAAPAATKTYDLPAGEAATTLKRFSAQSGYQVVFLESAVAGETTRAVQGRLTAPEALHAMLAGTRLTSERDEPSGSFAIRRIPDSSPGEKGPAAPPSRPFAPAAVPAAAHPIPDEAIVLSPFEVSSLKDIGYAASQSLSGSRLAEELRFIPAPVSVITREQLDDLAIADLQEAMQWSVNTVAANSTDAATAAMQQGTPTLSNFDTDIRTRGGIDATVARNFFKWSINSDTFNVERLDLSRGPNALLFGDSNLSGMVNISTKRAQFRPAASVQVQTHSYGGYRVSLDVNRPLIAGKLALRLNTMIQRTDEWRDFGRVDRKGVALASTWRPVPGLEVRLEGEIGWRNHIYSPPYLRSVIAAWNHVAVFDLPGSLTAAQASAAGLGRIGANTFIINVARAGDGAVDWATMGQTVAAGGVQSWVGVRLPPGSTLQPVSVLEAARLSATPVYTDFVVPSFAFSMKNGANRLASEPHTASLLVEKRIGRNLMVELAGNLQVEDRLNYTRQSGNVNLSYDVNRRLPAGYTINGRSDNPYFLQPYIQSYQRIFNVYTRVWEGRAAAVYRWETPWCKQSLGALVALRSFDSGQRRFTLTRTNGPSANLADASNAVYLRGYVSERQFSSIDFLKGNVYSLGAAEIEYVNHRGVSAGQNHADSQIRSFQVFASGSWLPSGNLRTVLGVRRDEFYSKQFNTHLFNPATGRYVRSDLTEILRASIDSPTAGAVAVLLPWLSLYGNTSRSYNPPTTAVLNYQNQPIAAPQGRTRELGAKFAVLNNRVSASFGFYDSEQKNNRATSNTLNNTLENILDLLGQPSAGTQHDTNTLRARGTEFELHANLTRSWTLTANVGRPHTDTRDSSPSFRAFYREMQPAWQAIAGNAADPRSAAIRTYLNTIDNTLRAQAAGDGEEDNFNRKLTGNLVTRYQFIGGRLRGVALGAGMNYLGDQKIGRSAATDAYVYSQGYALYSAFVRYKGDWRGRPWSLQANATNLLDTEKFRFLQMVDNQKGPYRIAPPRLIRVTLNFSL